MQRQDSKALKDAQQREVLSASIRDVHAQPRTIGPHGTTTIQTPPRGKPAPTFLPAPRGAK